MKKQLLLGALLLTATSAMADPIDLQKATAIASDYLSENTADPMLVKRAERDMTKARHLPAKTAQAAPYYIFSRGEGQGFVIVSGDDCLPDVLGYTESGDFIEDQMPPQLLSWLEMWAKAIEETQLRGENVSRKSEARKANYTTGGIRKAAADRVDVPVLLTSQWHQNWPYNCHCPYVKGTQNQAVTGCVATAAAQVLYYFRKDLPDLLGATTPTYDWCEAPVTESVPKGTPMKWGLMMDTYPGNLPQEYYDAIGYFHLAVGAYSAMGYGYSSGAYISALVGTYNDCFNVASKNIWTGHSECQRLAYADLIKKRPVVYAGYNSNNEGHAIVIDGYRASTDKYHFNFGWGGNGPEAGGNGWYIMEDEGVNGFGINPSITYDIHPKNINVETTVSTPQGFYANHDNKVRVTLKNKSTFPLEGIYLFLGTTYELPSDLKKAKSSVVVNIPNDGSMTDVVLSAKPAKNVEHFVFITDENLNILAQEKWTAESAGNDLLFKDLVVLGSNETETHNGREYTVVNGDHASFIATVLNRSEMSYQESPRIQIFGTDDEGETFTAIGNKPASNVNIEGGTTGDFVFTVASTSSLPLESGKLYAAALMEPLSLRTETTLSYEDGEVKMVYFTIRDAEKMTALFDESDDKVLHFSGAWNAYEFETLCNRRANASALVYDLRNVTGIGRVPVLEGKENNLILVGADVDVKGVNVISIDGETARADHLSLAVGHDYVMEMPVNANSVSLALNATPNVWQLVSVPCNFTMPDGIFAKRIDSCSSTGITNQTTNVTELEAGKTYLLMTSSENHQELTAISADGVEVLSAPDENVCGAVKGTFCNVTVTPDGTENFFYLDKDYFRPTTEAFAVSAFGGYFSSTKTSRAFRSNSNVTLDNAYISLGETLVEAYNVYDKYVDYVTADAATALLEKIAACEAIYTTRELDANATKELTKELRTMMGDFPCQLDGESMTTELDVTFLLVNPSFERGTTASSRVGSTFGWTVGNGTKAYDNSDYNIRGVGADGKYICYSNNNSTPPVGLGISQIVENVPKGVYALTAMVGTEPGNTVTIYANNKEQTVDASESGQFYLREARIDDILIREGETLTVGVRDCAPWYKADDFRLYFVRALTPEEDPTAIEFNTMDKEQRSTGCFDITGRRVTNPTRGLYIIDGKKVLVK